MSNVHKAESLVDRSRWNEWTFPRSAEEAARWERLLSMISYSKAADYRAFSAVDKWSRRGDDHHYRDLRDVYWNRLARERGEIEWCRWTRGETKISSRGEHRVYTENISPRVPSRTTIKCLFFQFFFHFFFFPLPRRVILKATAFQGTRWNLYRRAAPA